MPEPNAIRVLDVAEAQRYQKLIEYLGDLDKDMEPDAGPMLRYYTMLNMYLGILGPDIVWAQVPVDRDRVPLTRLAETVLSLTDSALSLHGTLREAGPGRCELSWTERP